MAMARHRVCGGGVLAITMAACGLVSMVTPWEQSEEEEQEGDDGDDWSDLLSSYPSVQSQPLTKLLKKTFALTTDGKLESHRLHLPSFSCSHCLFSVSCLAKKSWQMASSWFVLFPPQYY